MQEVTRNIPGIVDYYTQTEGSYRRWGQDPRRTGLYSLHFGYTESGEELENNSQALAKLNEVIIGKLQIAPGMRILDAGCGTGTLTQDIQAACPDSTVIGINISPNQLATAVQQRSSNLDKPYFSRQDYHQTSFTSDSFDRVVFCESFVHSPNKIRLLGEVSRLLKPNGQLFMADYLPIGSEREDLADCWKKLREGWEIPNFVEKDQLLRATAQTDFVDVFAEDVTPRIISSARLLGESCRAKLLTAEPVSDTALKNRQASVAFYDLLASRDLGYFFVSAKKK